MADTVADVMLNRLREWGIRQVFGYPGDGLNGSRPAWADAEGAHLLVPRPDQLGDAWDRALSADRPTPLDVRCDPNVPPSSRSGAVTRPTSRTARAVDI